MKKTLVAFSCSFLILLTACQKEALPEIDQQTIATKILGKWMLVKHSEETFNASNSLIYKDERVGDDSDSLIFKPGGKLFIYSNVDGRSVEDYEVLAGNVLKIENEEWKIQLLSETNLELFSEETDPATKVRDVAKASFKRP